MHERIRDRLEAAIYDFGLVYDHWDEIGLDDVAEREPIDTREFDHSLVAVIATAYWLAFPGGRFRQLLQRGVMMAEEDRNGRIVSPSFRLQGTDSPAIAMQKLAERIDRSKGEENAPDLRIGELRAFADAIAHSDVDAVEAVRQGYRRAFGIEEEDSEEL